MTETERKRNMDNEITVQKLLDITACCTHINIKRSDTGAVVISGVRALAHSKDKRQMARWEAFKDMPVSNIRPSVDIASLKRNRDFFSLAIEASIYVGYYKDAVKKLAETSGI